MDVNHPVFVICDLIKRKWTAVRVKKLRCTMFVYQRNDSLLTLFVNTLHLRKKYFKQNCNHKIVDGYRKPLEESTQAHLQRCFYLLKPKFWHFVRYKIILRVAFSGTRKSRVTEILHNS